jgi:hypothetical protein
MAHDFVYVIDQTHVRQPLKNPKQIHAIAPAPVGPLKRPTQPVPSLAQEILFYRSYELLKRHVAAHPTLSYFQIPPSMLGDAV